MKRIIYIFILVLLPIMVFSQRWKTERSSIVGGIGMTHFMGDLGGGGKDAAHFMGIRDIDFVTTRPAIQIGYRYRITKDFASKTSIAYGLIAAKDEASKSWGRQYRNLSFRSVILELSTQIEFYFLPEKDIARYSFSSLSSINNLSAYVFLGIGGFYYNPKAKGDDGKWYALKPLKTEGQGLNVEYLYRGSTYKTPDEYNGLAMCFPIGLGMKYNINRKWAIGLEISARYTTSDYVDDVSGRYFNYAQMQQQGNIQSYDPMSAFFADRHFNYDLETNEVTAKPGDAGWIAYDSGKPMRGNPDYNDAYIFTVVTVYYKLKKFNPIPKFR